MSDKGIYIIEAKRTANGSFLSALKALPATKLGALVIKSLLNSGKIDANIIDEVILGQIITGGAGQNPARQSAIYGGLPQKTPAFTVNKVCGSGLKSVCLAASTISSGNADLIIAGGQENMSLAMHAAYIREGKKFGNFNMLDLMQYDGLTDIFSMNAMGVTAENIAKSFNISREMQDEFALHSHQKASIAQKSGYFKNEILPIEIIVKKQSIMFENDESVRSDTNLEQLAKLRPVFDPQGTVTAGNSSPINDGAAILLVASADAVRRYNLTPLVRIASYAEVGVDPDMMGIGPVPASKKALSRAGWNYQDLDLIEANEAFAAQAIYVNQQMQWDTTKVNVNGGSIALGHPIGASGARVLVTLIHGMLNRNAKKALATLCIGGGMGIAMCLEKD